MFHIVCRKMFSLEIVANIMMYQKRLAAMFQKLPQLYYLSNQGGVLNKSVGCIRYTNVKKNVDLRCG